MRVVTVVVVVVALTQFKFTNVTSMEGSVSVLSTLATRGLFQAENMCRSMSTQLFEQIKKIDDHE